MSTQPKVNPQSYKAETFELYSVPSFESGIHETVQGVGLASTRQTVEPGDVLLCKINPRINRVWIVGTKGAHRQIASTEWVVVRTRTADPRFLMWQMRSEAFRERLLDDVSGVGGSLMRARTAGIEKLAIKLAPLGEQRRIVAQIEALFARTRRARVDLKRSVTLAERHMSAALAAAFRGDTPTTLDGIDAGSPPLVPLASIVESLRYGTAQKCSPEPHGTAVLRIPNVAHGRVDLSDLKYGALDRAELERLRLRVGDILIIRSNGSPTLVGRPALVGPEAEGLAFAGYLIRARPRLDRVVPAYLALMLQAPQIRDHIEINARSSSGVHNINSEELGALEVPMPPIEQQRAIADRLESERGRAVRLRHEATRSLALLDRLEQAILAKAFCGELVEQDPNDEPATALLKRLQGDAKTELPSPTRPPQLPNKGMTISPRTRGSAVPKNRADADVKGQPYLADRLRELGSAATAEDLFRVADLPIADFYKQLSDEVAKGWVKDSSGKLEAA